MKKLYVIVILVILVAAGIYFFRSKKTEQASSASDNFPIFQTQATVQEKSKWLTYTNTTAKYSFQYPPELEISPLSDRAVYVRSKKGSSVKVNLAVFYQEEFDNKPVNITSEQNLEDEVARRTTTLFQKKDPRHKTSFMGKPTILVEHGTYAADMIGEIFIWHGNQVLQIELPGLNSDTTVLSKILSTFSFKN